MARRRRPKKRINKKVALIGSGAFLLLAGLIVVALLHFGGDPSQYIADGDVALAEQHYELAENNYRRALAVKAKETQIELLFKLADVYTRLDQWPKVRASWEGVLLRDPDNIKAGLAILETLYQRADSQARIGWKAPDLWKEIGVRSTDLLAVAGRAGVLERGKAEWEMEGLAQAVEGQTIAHYLYFLRGRALFEQAEMGAMANTNEGLEAAREDLDRVIALAPQDVDAYWYLAKVAVVAGELESAQGEVLARQRALKQADEVLARAITAATDNPKAYLNRLQVRLEAFQRTKREPSATELRALEEAYEGLVQRFGDDADVYTDVSKFYWMCCFYLGSAQGEANMDKAVRAAEQAVDLQKESVAHAVTLAQLYYRKTTMFGLAAEADNAIRIARAALAYPDAQLSTGPRAWANKVNRLNIYIFLANCTIDQILTLDGADPARRQSLLSLAEEAVHQIGQLKGSGDDLQVIKWNGMLEMAKGNTDAAVKQLYAVYTKVRSSQGRGQRDPELAYALGRHFKETSEVGMTLECISTALEGGFGFTKPEAILDYLDVLGELNTWSHVISPVNIYGVDSYEARFAANERSRSLRIRALIHTNRIDEAYTALAALPESTPTTMALRLELLAGQIGRLESALSHKRAKANSALGLKSDGPVDASTEAMNQELDRYYGQVLTLAERLAEAEPTLLTDRLLSSLCERLIRQDQTARVRPLLDRLVAASPNSGTLQYYRFLLQQTDPGGLSDSQRQAVHEQAIAALPDPGQRALEQGMLLLRLGKTSEALDSFIEALAGASAGTGAATGVEDEFKSVAWISANSALDLTIQDENWALAQQVVETTRRMNLDRSQGQLFEARVAFARGQYKEALEKIDACLEARPVFSIGYMLRSTIRGAQADHAAAIKDIEKAMSMNPNDPRYAKVHLRLLTDRNTALGAALTEVERAEARRALERAVALNPADGSLLLQYAQQIGREDPFKAVAIYQGVQKKKPTLRNAVVLGRLATSLAGQQQDEAKGKALFSIAGEALRQAYAMAPRERAVLQAYAAYYQATGQEAQAEQLLREGQDERLLWRHLIGRGEVERAREILLGMYRERPDDVDVLRGLLVVGEINRDSQALKRYFKELLQVEDSEENRTDQLIVFLKTGLLPEAKRELAEFKRLYPQSPTVEFIAGWVALREGELEQARTLIAGALARDPENALAWQLKGQVNLALNDYQEAIVGFRRSVSLRDDPVGRLALARTILLAGRREEGLSELEALVSGAAAPYEARRLLEHTYRREGLHRKLVGFYQSMVEQMPDDAFWYLQAGSYELEQDRADMATQFFGRALKLKQAEYRGQSPDQWSQDKQYAGSLDGYLAALNAAGVQGDKRALAQVIEVGNAYGMGPFAPLAYYQMAHAKQIEGDRSTAVQYGRYALDRARLHYDRLAVAIQRLTALLGIEEVSTHCLGSASWADTTQSRFAQYVLAQAAGDWDQALAHLGQCLMDSSLSSADRAGLTIRRAELLTHAFEQTARHTYLEQAVSDYESLMGKMPNNVSVLNNLAYLLAVNDRQLPRALTYGKNALDLQPDSPTLMDTYGFVLYKSGRHKQALTYLSAAARRYQQFSQHVPYQVYEHIGLVREHLGQKAQAREAFQQALEAGSGECPRRVAERLQGAVSRLSPERRD